MALPNGARNSPLSLPKLLNQLINRAGLDPHRVGGVPYPWPSGDVSLQKEQGIGKSPCNVNRFTLQSVRDWASHFTVRPPAPVFDLSCCTKGVLAADYAWVAQ